MADITLRSRNVMAGRIRTAYTEAGNNGPAVVYATGADLARQAKPALAS